MLKEALSEMNHVRLYTPMDPQLSSGIVCFDVDGMSQNAVVASLIDQGVIASYTPYEPSYARLTPGIFNSEAEIRTAIDLVGEMR
jgi:isopenicillin-N epimerase